MPKTKEEEQVFYVGVKDPVELRRTILESSKELVEYLQRAERFKKLRQEKADQIEKLKTIMAKITSLTRKLKTLLPKTKLRAQLHKHEKKVMKKAAAEKRAKSKQEVPKEVKRPATELEKLESELNEIESRLTTMP